MKETWYVCFQQKTEKSGHIDCFGEFKSAMQADDFYMKKYYENSVNSTLIPAPSIFPKAWQQMIVKHTYNKIFLPSFSFKN
jgi:hypothetical protein